jgi:hypothetical protein
MKTARLFASAVLASMVAVPCAVAQGTVAGTAANLPSQSVSSGSYGPGNYNGGGSSAGFYGPGMYGPGSYGPGAYGAATPTAAGVSPLTGSTDSPAAPVPSTGQ